MVSVRTIIGIVIGLIVMANSIPSVMKAFITISNNSTGVGAYWGASEFAMYGLIPLIIIAIIIMKVYEES